MNRLPKISSPDSNEKSIESIPAISGIDGLPAKVSAELILFSIAAIRIFHISGRSSFFLHGYHRCQGSRGRIDNSATRPVVMLYQTLSIGFSATFHVGRARMAHPLID
jgi:hypothetical protein